MFTWWLMMLTVLGLGVAGMLYFIRWRGADPQTTEGNKVAKVTRVVAWIYVAACTVGGLTNAATTLWDQNITMVLPVKQFWPVLPENVDIQTPLAVVESGGFSQAVVSVSGLDQAARLWLAGANLAQAAVAVGVGLVIVRLCTSVMNRSLFAPSLVRGVRQVAGVVLLGGMLGQGFQLVGGSIGAHQVLGATAWGQTGETIPWNDIHNIIGLPSVAYEWEFSFWPVGIALVLMVLAELFRLGSKVQKDAEGLV